MSKYSDILVYLRKRSNLSQHELSRKTGISRSAISMYETGQREPDLETFEIFADFYNVDMNFITGSTSHNPSPSSDPALAADEEQLLSDYRSLTPPGKQYILQTVTIAKQSYGIEKNIALPDLEKAN